MSPRLGLALATVAAALAAASALARAGDDASDSTTGPAIPMDAPSGGLGYLDIKGWEADNGRIPNGAVLLVRAPGLSEEGAGYIARWRDPAAVVIDGARPEAETPAVRVLEAAGIRTVFAALPDPPPAVDARVTIAADGALGVRPSVAPVADPPPGGVKRLVEIGWDIPDEVGFAAAAAAGTPFDGAVLDPRIDRPDGEQPARFSWVVFGRRRITREWSDAVIAKLREAPAAFRASSFLRFNVTPGDVGWFEEAPAIVANAAAAARIVREAGLAGIFLDVEQYEGKLFDPREQPDDRPFASYEERARARGRDLMAAMVAEHPPIEVLCSYGYPVAFRDRARAEYGLLPAFLDGMLDAKGERATIIDGYEYSYPFKTARAFTRGRAESRRASGDRLAVAFGIWLDWNSGTRGWHPEDPSKNWFTPDEFRAAVRHALDRTDRYVWIYTERLDWYTGEHVSPAYREALAAARR